MKKPETNTLRIEPRKFHAAAVGMAMVLAYVDYEYFVQTFCWVFQPPIRIAIDRSRLSPWALYLTYYLLLILSLPAEHILCLLRELP